MGWHDPGSALLRAVACRLLARLSRGTAARHDASPGNDTTSAANCLSGVLAGRTIRVWATMTIRTTRQWAGGRGGEARRRSGYYERDLACSALWASKATLEPCHDAWDAGSAGTRVLRARGKGRPVSRPVSSWVCGGSGRRDDGSGVAGGDGSGGGGDCSGSSRWYW